MTRTSELVLQRSQSVHATLEEEGVLEEELPSALAALTVQQSYVGRLHLDAACIISAHTRLRGYPCA